ncbi:MAG: DUF2244 domain-containing protein [Dongiaceae bacterium]
MPTADGRADPVRFDAILTPHRSLGPLGFVVLMAVVAGVNFAAGITFALRGAWPVFGYCGLDVALFYWLFQLSYRSARMFERVRLTVDEVIVEHHGAGGDTSRWSFNPFWLRIQIEEPVEHDSKLVLSSHGRSVAIGKFLTPVERLELAGALREALQAQRDALATAPR